MKWLWAFAPTSVPRELAPSEVTSLFESIGLTGTKGYDVNCLYVNGRERIIRPNYDNPVCQAQFREHAKRLK